jgi:hypothetical protein
VDGIYTLVQAGHGSKINWYSRMMAPPLNHLKNNGQENNIQNVTKNGCWRIYLALVYLTVPGVVYAQETM